MSEGSRTPEAAEGVESMAMEWTEVDLIALPDDSDEPAMPILAGLSAAPSDLHASFLADLPHLHEAQLAHSTMVDGAGAQPEAHFSGLQSMSGVASVFAQLGGHLEGDSMVLPLQGAMQDRVTLELGLGSKFTALRLEVEGADGSHIHRTFALPPGTELGRAGWRGNALVLDLVRD